MSKESALAVFEDFKIRRVYDGKTETWYFSVVDIIAALIQQPDYQTARKYWNKLKERLKKEGSQSVTNCHQLKMVAEDGKSRLTRLADYLTDEKLYKKYGLSEDEIAFIESKIRPMDNGEESDE